LINWSLKDYVKPLITFLIFEESWHVRQCIWSSNINYLIIN
jgi:hypothetical protein